MADSSGRYMSVSRLLAVALSLALVSSIQAASGAAVTPTWLAPVQVAGSELTWIGIDLEVGTNSMYVLSAVYNYGNGQPLDLMKSADGGMTWTRSQPLWGNEGGMCVYTEGEHEVVLLTNGYVLAKSTDGGVSWSTLSTLPGLGWRFLTVGTNSSWLGTPDDGDVYVAGSMLGSSAIWMTRSVDGGVTWETPVRLTSSDFPANGFPRMTSDGSKLYAIYEIDSLHNGYATLATRSSSDWGKTWDEERVLVPNGGDSYMLRPYCFQTLDAETALVTYVDEPTSGDVTETTGNYGYYHFSTETYEPVGSVSGADWMVHEGFSAIFKEDRLMVAWIRALEPSTFPMSDIAFSYSTDSGVVIPPSLQDAVPASIDIRPDTISLVDQDRSLTAYIGLPEGYRVEDIEVDSVLLNEVIPATGVYDIEDCDRDKLMELMVKFDLSESIGTADWAVGETITMTVSGKLTNGTLFIGSDDVSVAPSNARTLYEALLTEPFEVPGAMMTIMMAMIGASLGIVWSAKRR